MSRPFGEWAKVFYDLGLVPLPLGDQSRKAKSAFFEGWQRLARSPYDASSLNQYVNKYGERNIGLATGTLIGDGMQLVAIDVDHPDFLKYVESAMPFTLSGKKGKKGLTWFALAPKDMQNKKLQSKGAMIVEVLANGCQTVLPPSIHPDTNEPYHWIGIPLYEADLRSLPVINDGFVLEMQSIINGSGQYFIGGKLDNGEELSGINEMQWMGVGGGGSTYDSRLRCIAHMVGTGWNDDDIIARIRRAQQEAVERAGEEFNWPDCERETQQQINDARKKGFDNPAKGGRSKIPTERMWAEWLKTQYDNPVCYADKVYIYREEAEEEPGGYFGEIPIKSLDAKIANTFEVATKPKIRTAVDTFCSLVYREKFGKNGEDYVCLANGTLRVSTMCLVDPSPEHELIYRLNVNWNPTATCPQYDAFLEWAFGGDAKSIQCWNEFCGLSLVDNMSYQKAMFLLGEGANGKSTLANLLVQIHHRSVIANVPITELDDERKVTSLVGKLLNISTEQSRITSITDNIFKLIVGGDPIVVRRLYSEAENNIQLKVRFLSLANELPPLSDNSEAMRRRLLILKCPNTIPEGKRDASLLSKLLAEKSGILRKWVESLRALNSRGFFEIPQISDEIVNEYTSSSDPVFLWSRSRLIKDDEPKHDISQVYLDFSEWGKMSGYRYVPNKFNWSNKMKSLGFKIKEITLPDGGVVVAINAKLRTPSPSIISSEF